MGRMFLQSSAKNVIEKLEIKEIDGDWTALNWAKGAICWYFKIVTPSKQMIETMLFRHSHHVIRQF